MDLKLKALRLAKRFVDAKPAETVVGVGEFLDIGIPQLITPYVPNPVIVLIDMREEVHARGWKKARVAAEFIDLAAGIIVEEQLV